MHSSELLACGPITVCCFVGYFRNRINDRLYKPWLTGQLAVCCCDSILSLPAFCADGQRTSGPRYRTMDDVTAGRCHWPLEEPRHGAAVTVVITCVNRVQIQTSVTSQPAVVLLRPPDVSHVSLPV